MTVSRVTRLLCAAVCGMAAASHAADDFGASEEGLVAYWRFDEAEGDREADASGNGHEATIEGQVERVEGRIGGGVYFSGEKGDGVATPDAEDLNPTDAITVEAWVKPDALKREAQYDIVSKAGDRGPGYRLFISWNSLRFRSGGGFGEDFWDVGGSLAGTPMTWGRWHHLAATYDGQVYRVYLNGVELASGGTLHREKERIPLDGATHPITVNDKPLTIGSFSQGYAYVFRGAIDEVKIYARAKSAAEIFRAAKEY